MTASRTSKRVAWIDAAKGVGIILIVLGHANRSIDRTATLTWTDGLQTLDAVLYSFHVPLFFVLAGVSAALARPGWGNGLRGVVVGVAVPYLVWSVIWVLSKSLLPGGLVNQPLDLSAILQILWMPFDHFWFLYHLVLIRLVWLLAESTLDRTWQIVLMLGLALSGAAVRALGAEWAFVAHFLDNAALFGFGMLIVQSVVNDTQRHLLLGLVCLAVFASLVAIFGATDLPVISLLVSLAGLMTVLFAAATLEKHGFVGSKHWLARIGQASLVIFLLHGFAIGLARFGLSQINYLTNESLLIVGTGAGVVLPLLAYVVVEKMSEKSGKPLMSWMGWGRWRPSAMRVQQI